MALTKTFENLNYLMKKTLIKYFSKNQLYEKTILIFFLTVE